MTDDDLIAAARDAAAKSYSPYSGFPVGAALRFADGSVVTGTNIENASYGLALCAETVAVSKAMADRCGRARRGCRDRTGDEPITPCGRCRRSSTSLRNWAGPTPTSFAWARTGSAACGYRSYCRTHSGPRA